MFRAPICGAHCAVIFAIAQLSCYSIPALLLSGRKNTQDGELFSHTVRLSVFLRHIFGYTNVELVKYNELILW